jgi:predicted dienelactone hydrolase
MMTRSTRSAAPAVRLMVASAACAALLLAACSGSDDAGPTGTATDAASTTATQSTDAPTTDAPTSDAPTTDAPTTDAPTTDAPTTDAALAAFETIGPGAYDVGVQTITITDADRNRPLTVDVWFPIDDATGLPAHQYTLLPGVYYESPTAVDADSTMVAPGGPFPLVVYSHGSGGLRYLDSNYTEAIASHGYIVAAPDHTGNTAIERLGNTEDDFDVIALNRPQDIEAVIDAMTDPAHPEAGAFAAGVDPEQIAVTGHSFGGFTAYAMASGYTNALGTFEADPRVDAIIPLAPATGDGSGRLLSDEDLAAITVPALVMVGTNDQTAPPTPNVDRPWELSKSEPSYRADFVDGQHQTFSDFCEYQQTVPLLPNVPPLILDTINAYAAEGCSPGDMPIDRAHDLQNTLAVTFLDSVFRGGEMIDPDVVAIPDDLIYAVK